MSEWISVKDELPGLEQRIDAKSKDGSILSGRWERIDVDRGVSFFIVPGICQDDYDWINNVTHWRPQMEGPFTWGGEFVEYIKDGQVRHSCRPYDVEFLVDWINRVLSVES